MNRTLLLSILAFVGGLAAVFSAPALLVNPGPLIAGHAKLEGNCFACHTPFLGPGDDKCVACHKPAEIGAKKPGKVTFHQQLTEQRCDACHTDHTGRTGGKATRAFDHALLRPDTREPCTQCHTRPTDNLHKNSGEDCKACHGTDRWKPATFDHDKYFRFDWNHPADCKSCHTGPDYKTYTCYGCHEHSEASIRGEHLEEGIRDFADCVKCHRSGDEDEAEYLWKSQRWQQAPGERRWRDHDDDDDDDEYEHRGWYRDDD